MKKGIRVKSCYVYMILIIFGILISFQSSTSPMNTEATSTDVSVWISIAKKMEHGQVMYRDIFDHKGPILYLIYYLGYTFRKNLGNLDYRSSM